MPEEVIKQAASITDQLPVVGALLLVVAGFLWYLSRQQRVNIDASKEQAKAFTDSMETQSGMFATRADDCHKLQNRALDTMEETTKTTSELNALLRSWKGQG